MGNGKEKTILIFAVVCLDGFNWQFLKKHLLTFEWLSF